MSLLASLIYLSLVPEYNHLVFLGYLLLIPSLVSFSKNISLRICAEAIGFMGVALGRPSAAIILFGIILILHVLRRQVKMKSLAFLGEILQIKVKLNGNILEIK